MLLCSEARLSTRSNKHLEVIENLHTVPLIHKLLSSSANSTDLPFGFDSIIPHRRHELTNNEEAGQKAVFYNRIRLFDTFGFAQNDEITNSFGYNLVLKQDTNNKAI